MSIVTAGDKGRGAAAACRLTRCAAPYAGNERSTPPGESAPGERFCSPQRSAGIRVAAEARVEDDAIEALTLCGQVLIATARDKGLPAAARLRGSGIVPPPKRARERTPMASPAPKIPSGGEPITLRNGRLEVPQQPILPFIEGDGTGPDIWRASRPLVAPGRDEYLRGKGAPSPRARCEACAATAVRGGASRSAGALSPGGTDRSFFPKGPAHRVNQHRAIAPLPLPRAVTMLTPAPPHGR